MSPAAGLPEVVPELAAITGIDRPPVVGGGDVDGAVHLQRRRLEGHAAASIEIAGALAADNERCRAAAAAIAAARECTRGGDRSGGELRGPGEREVHHVLLVDLRECAVALARIVAVVGDPPVGEWLQEVSRFEPTPLRKQKNGGAGERQRQKNFFHSHFSVARYAVTSRMSLSVSVCSIALCGSSGSLISTFVPAWSRGNVR